MRRKGLRRLRRPGDSEWEQAAIRLLIAAIYLAYCLWLAVAGLVQPAALQAATLVGVAFTLFAAGLLLHVRYRTGRRPARLGVALVADVCTATAAIHYLGAYGVPLFPVYLWIAIGHGFRYGSRYLLLATLAGLVGFPFMVLTTPYWYQQLALVAGALVLLSVIPLYVWLLLRRLESEKRRAEAANDAKSRFLANMSHELRTPLNALLGLSHVLEAEMDLTAARPERLLGDLRASARAMAQLVEDILDFSKIEADQISLTAAPLDLYALLVTVAQVLRPGALSKGLDFTVEVDPSVPPWIDGDGMRLRQVIMNLAGNAIKFTDRGRVRIRVTVQVQPDSRSVLRCEVVDTGVGISEAALPYIFERFRQEDEGTGRRYGGTGLGTAIAKQLVELMGGSIGAWSRKGTGSRFWFAIPLHSAVAADDPDVIAGIAQAEILVLADDREFQELICRHLRRLGAQHVHVGRADGMRGPWTGSAPRPVWTVSPSTAPGRAGSDGGAARYAVFSTVMPTGHGSGNGRDVVSDFRTAVRLPFQPRELQNALHLLFAASRDAFLPGSPEVARVPPGVVGSRILVGEDNRISRLVFERVLQRGGFEVDAVATGAAALEALLAGGYCLAVLDIQMPEMSGIDVIRRYHEARGAGVRVPVVVVTADATTTVRDEVLRSGAADFLTKPVEPERLLATVRRYLHARDGGKDAANR